MADVFLVSGPPAAGKTTVARLLAKRFERGVHVEGDVFRRSIVAGRADVTPGPSDGAMAQLRLRYRLAAATADGYAETGFTVVVENVVAGGGLPARADRAAVAGVDASPGGWAVAVWHPDGAVEFHRVTRFAEAASLPVEVVAVDIPIGPPEQPPRPADVEARAFVGPRAGSVFPTPPRSVLDAPDYQEALRRHRELAAKGLSIQAYSLCRRMLEVEARAFADPRIIEVHPEVSFRELAGRPLAHSKRTALGLAERRRLLEDAGLALPARPPRLPLADALDAAVAAWTAARWSRGEARPFPEGPHERVGAIWR